MTSIETVPETDESTLLFRELRRLKYALGLKPNKNELVAFLIGVCILNGRDTRTRIVGTLRAIDFKVPHIISVLNYATGEDPGRHRWKLDFDGRYILHPTEAGADNE